MIINRTVHFTQSSENDLESIADWIALDNPLRALSFIFELRTACAELSSMSDRFQKVPRYKNVRRRVYGNYVIFYQVNVETVTITHIVHGAIDFDTLNLAEY